MMSILETFYILFKSDASDVKKGAEEAEKSTKKLNESLNSVNKNTEKVGKSFYELTKAAIAFLGASAAAYTVFQGFKAATDYTLQIGNVSRALGVNVEQLDAWSNAVQRTGGTTQGFQQSLRSLSEHLGGSAQIALKVLPQLADVFQRLGRIRAFQYGKMLGLDESTILLLQQGRREVEAQIAKQRELGIVTQRDTEAAFKFNNALVDTRHAFRELGITLDLTILPILTKVFNVITPLVEYLVQHKDLVVGAFIAIGIAAAIMVAPFLLANAAIIITIGLITELIGIFAIAYEDIQAFRAGNQSLTGDLIKRWTDVRNVIGDTLKFLGQVFDVFLSPLKSAVSITEKLFSLLGGDKQLAVDINSGKTLLNLAGSNPIASQTSNSIFRNQSSNRNNAINTGPITINTQATDADGIAAGLGKGLNEQLWQSNSFFDDGVAI